MAFQVSASVVAVWWVLFGGIMLRLVMHSILYEAKSKAQEREILQLISAKENAELRGGKPPPADAGGGGGDGGAGLEERVGELEDELYEAQQRAEEEADRAKQLEAEKEELLSQVRMLSHGT